MKRAARSLVLLSAIMLAGLALSMTPAHANSTLFYDSFSGQGFPSQWSGIGINGQSRFIDQSNVSQTDNWMVLKVPNIVGVQSAVTSAVANQSGTPILGPNTVDGQTVYMVWKMVPFNLTAQSLLSPGGATLQSSRTVEVDFGLRNQAISSPWNQIMFKLLQSDILTFGTGGYLNYPSTAILSKSQVDISIAHPMPSAANCYDSDITGASFTVNTCVNNVIQYETPGQTIDLNTGHIFTIYGRFYPASHTSWVTFNVDNLMLLNMTQAACSCIDQTAAGGSYASMYPLIRFFYTDHVNVNGGAGQTPATFVNYVLVDDYIPATLPAGSLFTCSITSTCPAIPPSEPVPGSNGIDIGGTFTFVAYDMGKGNVALGGLMLSLLILVPLFLVLGRLRVGGAFPYASATLGVVGLNSILGLIPLWVTILVVLIILFVVFVLKRDSIGGIGGGQVPD
jgi:hypothetical protein